MMLTHRYHQTNKRLCPPSPRNRRNRLTSPLSLSKSKIMASALASSFVTVGCPLKPSTLNCSSTSLSLGPIPQKRSNNATSRSRLVVRASYRDGGRPSGASIFVGGFMLGGLIVGTLGCVYAPQISKALSAADKKDLMRKLPKFIYDEEKALEKTRQILAEKIAQLNSAIDDVSVQLRAEDDPNGVAVTADEVEAVN